MLSIPPCTRSSARPLYLMRFVTSGWDRDLPVWPARQRSPSPSHRHGFYSQAAKQYCVLAAKVSCQPRLPPPIGAWQWLKALFLRLVQPSQNFSAFFPGGCTLIVAPVLDQGCLCPPLCAKSAARCGIFLPCPFRDWEGKKKTSRMLKHEGLRGNFWEKKW